MQYSRDRVVERVDHRQSVDYYEGMEDIFALDDTEVDVVSRAADRSGPRAHLLGVHDGDEVSASTVTHGDRAADAQAVGGQGTDDSGGGDFNFEYMPARTTRAQSPTTSEPFELGLDEEVVVKRRAPQAKLDDDRLLGPLGIPKLRDQVLTKKKKIGFRKGHELDDLNKFIEGYQFWAHELFPKAKFRDAVKMINKVGKSRRMKVHRRQIITDLLPKTTVSPTTQTPGEETGGGDQIPAQAVSLDDFSMSEDEDFLMHANMETTRPDQGIQGISNNLAEQRPVVEVDDFDDMDALEAMGVMATNVT